MIAYRVFILPFKLWEYAKCVHLFPHGRVRIIDYIIPCYSWYLQIKFLWLCRTLRCFANLSEIIHIAYRTVSLCQSVLQSFDLCGLIANWFSIIGLLDTLFIIFLLLKSVSLLPIVHTTRSCYWLGLYSTCKFIYGTSHICEMLRGYIQSLYKAASFHHILHLVIANYSALKLVSQCLH